MATVAELVKGYGPDFPSLEDLFGLEPTEAQLLQLSEPTPALGRYIKDVAFLRDVTSQRALGQLRFRVLIERYIALSHELDRYGGKHRGKKVVHSLPSYEEKTLPKLARSPADIIRAEAIEKFTEHDTAAAGDYLKLLIGTRLPHLEPMIEGIGFADTSEDTMSPVFGLIANTVVFGYFVPKLIGLMSVLLDYVDNLEKDGPLVLPGLIHKQGAEPTTFGKKITTNLWAIDYHLRRLRDNHSFIPFGGKLGGALGNLTTHYAAYSDIDWRVFARRYIENLGLTYDEMTFQSSTYALEAGHFTTLAVMLSHLIKLVVDFIDLTSSLGQLFVKRKKPGTKGSSIMPTKSNLWSSEGALKMLRKARTALIELALELPDYAHEGDMGRSYLMRDLGTVFMPAFIALSRIGGEIVGDMVHGGCAPNPEAIAEFFHKNPGLAGSSIQTVLKREQIPGDAYRQIEAIAINSNGTYANAEQFGAGLEQIMEANNLDETVRQELRRFVQPANNIGKADTLAKEKAHELRQRFIIYKSDLRRFRDIFE